jgi:hypothetical protein
MKPCFIPEWKKCGANFSNMHLLKLPVNQNSSFFMVWVIGFVNHTCLIQMKNSSFVAFCNGLCRHIFLLNKLCKDFLVNTSYLALVSCSSTLSMFLLILSEMAPIAQNLFTCLKIVFLCGAGTSRIFCFNFWQHLL